MHKCNWKHPSKSYLLSYTLLLSIIILNIYNTFINQLSLYYINIMRLMLEFIWICLLYLLLILLVGLGLCRKVLCFGYEIGEGINICNIQCPNNICFLLCSLFFDVLVIMIILLLYKLSEYLLLLTIIIKIII